MSPSCIKVEREESEWNLFLYVLDILHPQIFVLSGWLVLVETTRIKINSSFLVTINLIK